MIEKLNKVWGVRENLRLLVEELEMVEADPVEQPGGPPSPP